MVVIQECDSAFLPLLVDTLTVMLRESHMVPDLCFAPQLDNFLNQQVFALSEKQRDHFFK